MGTEPDDPIMREVAAALEDARRELIDPSRRNRLLHAPRSRGGSEERRAAQSSGSGGDGNGNQPSPRRRVRPHCLEVEDADPSDIFQNLQAGKAYGFDAQPLRDRDEAAAGKGRRIPLRLRTSLAPEVLERRLLRYFRDSRSYEEEQGVNILFLALGFLKWFEDDRSKEVCWAPLILLPVSLERRQGADQFVAKARDDDLIVNVSLRERLRLTHGIDLPDFPDEDDWLPSAYFDGVRHAVAGQNRWEVDGLGCGLGFFTFSKFLMWRDLYKQDRSPRMSRRSKRGRT